MCRIMKFAIGIIFACFLPHLAFSTIINVPGDSATIQAAVDGTIDGDTVLVADGTYTGDGNRDIGITDKDILLISENGPESTIIDCQADIANQHIAIHVTGSDCSPTIDGFTITNAYSDESSGAIRCYYSGPIIRNCIITENDGSGIYTTGSLPVTINNCRISYNAFQGIKAESSIMVIVDSCNISFNGYNGLEILWSTSINMSNSLIASNDSCGISYWAMGSIHISNCTIVDNLIGTMFFAAYPKDSIVRQDPGVSNCIIAFNEEYGIFNDPHFKMFDAYCNDSYGNPLGDWVNCDPYFGPGDANGNISEDPRFCAFLSGNYELTDISPCAAANNSCAELIGVYDVGCMAGNRLWYVKADGTGDAPTIQAAVDSAISGDSIQVASGTYTGDGNRDINFGTKIINMFSDFGPELTIIDCQATEQDPHWGISNEWYADGESQILGFTITNAWTGYNGAINVQSPMIIFDCIINNNGMSGIAAWADVFIFNSVISDNLYTGVYTTQNTVMQNSLIAGNEGEGFCMDADGDVDVSGCTVVSNGKHGLHLNGYPPKGGSQVRAKGNANISNTISAFNGEVGIERYFYSGDINITCCNSFGNIDSDWGNTDASAGDENGNISEDPIFCDTASGNYKIMDISPCAPVNNSCGQLIGTFGIGCMIDNRTWYVKADGSGDAPTIQAAIDSAIIWDTILVAAGTYTGEGNRDIEFRGKSIILVSESGPEVTIIDCDGTESDRHSGLRFVDDEDTTTIVEGLTIIDAWGEDGYTGYYRKGAVFCSTGTPMLQNCIIRNNHGNGLVSLYRSLQLQLIGCTITHNGAHGFCGGGAVVKNSEISFNDSDGVNIDYSGILDMDGCLILGNVGMGVFSDTFFDPFTVKNSTFVGNGYGLYWSLFIPKDSSKSTGDRYYTTLIENNLFAFNQTGGIRIGAYQSGENVAFCNNSYGNPGGDWNTFGHQAGDESGNISEDPIFCDTTMGDYRLELSSPCLPENNTCGILMGKYNAGCAWDPLCGDVNGSESVNLLDVTYIIACLYKGGPCPPLHTGDVNDSGDLNILDITYLLNYLYKGGPVPVCPPPPGL